MSIWSRRYVARLKQKKTGDQRLLLDFRIFWQRARLRWFEQLYDSRAQAAVPLRSRWMELALRLNRENRELRARLEMKERGYIAREYAPGQPELHRIAAVRRAG